MIEYCKTHTIDFLKIAWDQIYYTSQINQQAQNKDEEPDTEIITSKTAIIM